MSTAPRSRPNTRAKNANQHPGQILLEGQRTRRTSEQVLADDKKIADEYASLLANKEATAQRIARLEGQQRKRREASSLEAARPLTQEQLSEVAKGPDRSNSKQAATGKPANGDCSSLLPASQTPEDDNTPIVSTVGVSAPPRKRGGKATVRLTRADVESAAMVIDANPQSVDNISNGNATVMAGLKRKTTDDLPTQV